jgi:tRNA(adenine34) deaminase
LFALSSHDPAPFMAEALDEARKAGELMEVPVGAVIVYRGEVISRAHNLREAEYDSTAHAEILAIRQACRVLGRWRLEDATLYVTLEPCLMCAGAILSARIPRLVYGASDPKAGAVVSLYRVLEDRRLNHQVEVVAGVLEEECSRILSSFFQKLRNSKSTNQC